MFGCKQPLNRLNKKAPSEEEAIRLALTYQLNINLTNSLSRESVYFWIKRYPMVTAQVGSTAVSP